ncbi:RES domain protein [Legionella nautarum]|uniref:RES domain protein n=1 Tax=Legionella nautarum TaxID=45070 RepID=A0A0W0WTP6_9GAMM|nr:RES family NAD+ phosphorylase [Legionella nautarum]KTD35706.1 RES domain protein [Legionella nautarum]
MSVWFRGHQHPEVDIVFSGEGGLSVAGRWNHLGTKAVYGSQSISLSTLEWLSHNGLPVSGFSYYKFSIEIPEELLVLYKVSDLPKEWKNTPSPNSCRDFAAKNFYDPKQYLAMAIPSVMVPEEFNLVINPLHNAFVEVKKTVQFLGKFTAPHR